MLQAAYKSGIRVISVVIVVILLTVAMAVGGISLFGPEPSLANDGNPGQRILRFVAVSDAGTDATGIHHRIAMTGDGKFTSNHVNANGSFVHWDQNTAGPGLNILASGTWKSRKVLSYTRGFGTAGNIDSGILEMEVDLFPEGGPRTTAVLRLICNIGFAGIATGEPEGYVLDIPSAGLTFNPLVPALGLTHISVPGSG